MTVLMALALSASALGMAQQSAPPMVTSKQLYPETKDRLSNERMKELVAGPVKALDMGDLALAESRFVRLLAKAKAKEGPASLTAADLEVSFGVTLYMFAKFEAIEDAEEASIRHLELSVAAYEAHFGRQHAETALALTSLSDALGELSDGGKVEQRIPLIRESLTIRQAALGDGNPETLANRVNLIVLLTHPDIKDRRYFEEASVLAAELLRLAPAGMPPGHLLSRDRLGLAAVLPMIRIGQVDKGVSEVKRVMTAFRTAPGEGADCFGMSKMLDRVRDALVAVGSKDRTTEIGDDVIALCLGDLLKTMADRIE